MERILFVCLGNICRSPMAQMVLIHLAKQAGVAVACDSAGTSSEELGNPVHPGTRRKLQEVGIALLPHRARQMTRADYGKYDRIIAMDRSNLRGIHRITGGDPAHKVRLLLDHTGRGGEVADPWYTGNFDRTYEDILAGCTALLEELKQTQLP